MQRLAGLAQREVERGAVERPAAVEARDLAALGLDREQVEAVDQLAELAQRVAPRQVEHRPGLLEGDVVLGVVDDVLADALGAGAVEVDDGGEPLKAARDLLAAAPPARSRRPRAGGRRAVERAHRPTRAAGVVQPRHELLQAQFLEPLADGVQLAGAVLDQLASLLDQVERLAQPGLAGVQPADDLLDPGHRRLVGRARSFGLLLVGDLGRDGSVVEAQAQLARAAGGRRRAQRLPARSSTSA